MDAINQEGNNYLHDILSSSDSIDVDERKSNLEAYVSKTPRETANIAINSRNTYGSTPLMEYVSCIEPRSEIVRIL